MSPTVLYAAIFPRRDREGRPLVPFTPEDFFAPRFDGITEADVRCVVRQEIARLDVNAARAKYLERLIMALESATSSLSAGGHLDVINHHIVELREELNRVQGA